MQSASLFREVTRYAGPENRLTQVLASTLSRVPHAALALARCWSDPSAGAARERASPTTSAAHGALSSDLTLRSVRTQVPTVSGKQVDLELRFGAHAHRSDQDVLLWIESKLNTHPRDRQVAAYAEDIEVETGLPLVVLLAPRASLPYGTELVPDGVPQRSWQATGRLIEHLLGQGRALDPIDRYLLKELVTYMREDNLTDPQAVTPELLVALACADRAEDALVRICEDVSSNIARLYGREADRYREFRGKREFGWNYWEAWDLQTDQDGPVRWLDWNARNQPTHEQADGRSLFFMTGLVAKDYDRLIASPEDTARMDSLFAGVEVDGKLVRGFKPVTDDCKRIARTAFPEEVLIGRTLEAQAHSLAEWVVDTLRAAEQVGFVRAAELT